MSAQGMPPQILALFASRPPLEYMEPLCGDKKKPEYTGITDYIKYFDPNPAPPVPKFETPRERKERRRKEKLAEHRKKQEELIAKYNPHAAECATKNPYATLFVGRLSYEVTEKRVKKEFECFGPIKRVKVITDFNGKSRGYAFIEYETEEALKSAYKQGDGKKIDGRRVLVDVERSRTVAGWIPRRLGGGKGPARYVEPKKKTTTAPSQPPSFSQYPNTQDSRRQSSGMSSRDYRGYDGGHDKSHRRHGIGHHHDSRRPEARSYHHSHRDSRRSGRSRSRDRYR